MKQVAKWIAGLSSPACNLISEGGKRVLLVAFPADYIINNSNKGKKDTGWTFFSDYQLSTKGRPLPTEGLPNGKSVFIKGTFAIVPHKDVVEKSDNSAERTATEAELPG